MTIKEVSDRLLKLMEYIATEDRLRIVVEFGMSFEEAKLLTAKAPEMLFIFSRTLRNMAEETE